MSVSFSLDNPSFPVQFTGLCLKKIRRTEEQGDFLYFSDWSYIRIRDKHSESYQVPIESWPSGPSLQGRCSAPGLLGETTICVWLPVPAVTEERSAPGQVAAETLAIVCLCIWSPMIRTDLEIV